MRHRPSSLFRGSELPRLLFLAAIVLAGWPMYLIFGQVQTPSPPPPPTVLASKLTPVVPDTGVEFQALLDKAPIQIRESAAYAILLKRVRETPPEELASQARRDVFYTNLWERPEHFRGVPIHFVGTAKKVLTHEVGPSMSPKGRLYEVWFYSDENRAFPIVMTIEDAPPGLVVGHELNLRVTMDGYFMKLLGYRAGDTFRASPMLVGRMHWTPAPAAAPSSLSEFKRFSRRDLAIAVLVLALIYVFFRVIFQIRKEQAPRRVGSAFRSSGEGLPPEEVSEWLQNLPESHGDSSRDNDKQSKPKG